MTVKRPSIKISVNRVMPNADSRYAGDMTPLLEMTTEFPELAAANLRMLADRIERETDTPVKPPIMRGVSD